MWSPRPACARVNTHVKDVLTTRPWLHWAFVYAVSVLFFLAYRLAGLSAYLQMFGSKRDNTFGVRLSGVLFGFCEDLACINYLAVLLWLYDTAVRRAVCKLRDQKKLRATLHVLKRVVRFLVYLFGFLVIAAPVVANNLLIRLRQMRFTMEYIQMYLNEKDAATSVEVSAHELHAAYTTVVIMSVVTVFFSVVGALWVDLSRWSPLDFVFTWCRSTNSSSGKTLIEIQDQEQRDLAAEPEREGDANIDLDSDYTELEQQSSPASSGATNVQNPKQQRGKKLLISAEARALKLKHSLKTQWQCILLTLVLLAVALILFPYVLLEITQKGVSSVVAGVALNTSLSEMFRLLFKKELLPGLPNGQIDSAALYLDSTTEEYTLFKDDVLYRRTTGFKGDLAFDVQVDQEDLPNVLVVVVESFRYHDSQYLVGEDNKYLFKDQNITITPNFDRWAKRGISFRNLWSSWRTSRSLESILFGQLPYDSATTSGTSGGSATTELSGMPQLFKAKGYEASFTTGCRTDYDQWDKFLPSHGFDEVLNMKQFKALAEKDLGISPKDWALKEDGGQARAMSYWGVHDDVSFEVLGNILTNRTDAQKARVKNNEPKKPFFINHYTISSHATFYDRPEWYVNYTKPDFSALMEGEKYSKLMKQYFDMRYFQDMALGKFMDRMEKQGILNDTIVVIVGDHGQAPEFGLDTPEDREVSVQRVAATMIAEGRLGKYAGIMFDDAAEQYDLLNTLADIVGLPKDGLMQTGVGRSLKRKIPFGQRVVWSNNPSRKMSVVRGHERLQYDRMSNALLLHDADKDHDMKKDLYPDLDGEKEDEWIALRNAGRKVNAYFKDRWKKECLLKTDC